MCVCARTHKEDAMKRRQGSNIFGTEFHYVHIYYWCFHQLLTVGVGAEK